MSEIVNQATETELTPVRCCRRNCGGNCAETGTETGTEASDPSAMTLSVFGQLLEPEGIAPAQDFAESGRLICEQTPSIELRAKIRFILNEDIQFDVGAGDDVRRLMRHWRAELSPQIENTDEDLFVSGFADDEASGRSGIGGTDHSAGEPSIRSCVGPGCQ